MTPTNRLRFVERWITEPHPTLRDVGLTKQIRILQQWWVFPFEEDVSTGEWRDVPLEEEE